jgi:hypothetical protein
MFEIGLLGGYSRRVYKDEYEFGDGKRWSKLVAIEGTAWAALRPTNSRLFRLGALVSAGPGAYTLNSFGRRYSQQTFSWSVHAGPGYGPAFLLLGVSGPIITTRAAEGVFRSSLVTVLSLNMTFDLLTFLRPPLS